MTDSVHSSRASKQDEPSARREGQGPARVDAAETSKEGAGASRGAGTSRGAAGDARRAPGSTSSLERTVQMRRASGLTGAQIVNFHKGDQIQRAAQRGLEGSAGALPHLDTIQKSFGGHDVSQVRSFVGGAAREASKEMGAHAYATGDAVAFGQAPDLHTAAHEAAHVVQQRGGVQLKGNVGQPGDAYERHADEVADAVVQGRSAEPILNRMAAPSASGARPARRGPVQMRSDLNGYAADSQVNQDYQTLVREQETALGTLRGQQNGERTGTYGTIFEDAKAFASALAEQLKSRLGEKLPLSSQVTLSLREYGSMMGLSVPSTVKTNLENPTQGEARAKNHIKGGGDVFKAFEGRWRGQWNRRENDDSTHVDGTFDHDWQPTEPSQAGSQVLTQPVVMGGYDASQPARGANQGIQSGSPSAAVNAVDKDTGIITGAVGVNQGKAARPHAGYFVNDRTLIWVARENESSGGILYSCFFEHRRPSAASAGQGAQPGAAGGSGGATAQAVPAGSYVIMGLQFIWNRSTQRLSVQRLMGGLYTTPPSQKKLGGSAGKP